jgi:hypothetical protein
MRRFLLGVPIFLFGVMCIVALIHGGVSNDTPAATEHAEQRLAETQQLNAQLTEMAATLPADNTPTMADPLSAPITNPDLAPIVFVGAMTGSGLYAKLDKPKDQGFWPFKTCKSASLRCSCTADWYKLYFDPMQLVTAAPCFFQNYALDWDASADGGVGDIVGKEGVQVATENGASGGQPKGTPGAQGDPSGRGLDYAGCAASMSSAGGLCNMYVPMMTAGIQHFGYSMAQYRSISYDFRLGPKQWRAPIKEGLYETGLFDRMKSVFEEVKKTHGNKALMISLSEGGTVAKSFLDYMSQEWKDEYIEGWVSYSGVFAGSTQMAWNQMSGLPFYTSMVKSATKGMLCKLWPSFLGTCPGDGVATFTAEDFRNALQNHPGMGVTAPTPTGTISDEEEGSDNNILFYTPSRNYKYSEYAEAMDAAGLTNTAQVYRSVLPIRPSADKDPGVRTWCIYSNTSTTIGYKYDFDFNGDRSAKQPSSFVYGDGDGTVHRASLAVCDRWVSKQTGGVTETSTGKGKTTTVHRFQGYTHSSIMTDPSMPTASILEEAINNAKTANTASKSS